MSALQTGSNVIKNKKQLKNEQSSRDAAAKKRS